MKAKLVIPAVCLTICAVHAQTIPVHWKTAPAPPMGWNSWDCFGTTITEDQAKAQADAM
ncbi:MAG: hypothetical protein V4819_21115 [Verrucomicrobiota bacterium]